MFVNIAIDAPTLLETANKKTQLPLFLSLYEIQKLLREKSAFQLVALGEDPAPLAQYLDGRLVCEKAIAQMVSYVYAERTNRPLPQLDWAGADYAINSKATLEVNGDRLTLPLASALIKAVRESAKGYGFRLKKSSGEIYLGKEGPEWQSTPRMQAAAFACLEWLVYL